jgi:hypothetical protein
MANPTKDRGKPPSEWVIDPVFLLDHRTIALMSRIFPLLFHGCRHYDTGVVQSLTHHTVRHHTAKEVVGKSELLSGDDRIGIRNNISNYFIDN